MHFESGRCAPRPSHRLWCVSAITDMSRSSSTTCKTSIANISSSHLQRHNHGLHVLYACAPRTARALAAQALGRTFPVHAACAAPQLTSRP